MRAGPLRVHQGVCDASGAVFVRPDGTQFLVANDEDQGVTHLRLYDAGTDGPPLAEHLLDNGKLQPDAASPEIDLEASAWLGSRIFWIGSHSRSKKGKPRPSRHRLFATALRKGKPEISGAPYTGLLEDLAKLLDFNLDPARPPKDGGVSIEGLSATEHAGELLIGFRSPLARKGRALVIPLQNADDVVDRGAAAKFGDPICLDLGGLGIRSMDYWPERHTYLLIAGPVGGEPGQYCVMRWSGPLSSRPEVLDLFQFGDLTPEGAAPEALMIHRRSETVYVLFDEGNRADGGVKCKDSENKSFRSLSLTGF
jgi:hypothetical protein